MTMDELTDFYDTQKLNYCISYNNNGYTVTFSDKSHLFPSDTTFFVPGT